MGPVDAPLPAPLTLWARVAAMKAVYSLWDDNPGDVSDPYSPAGVLTGGRMLVWSGNEDWFEIVRYSGDRAVMFGDTEGCSSILSDLPAPIDLLAYAPAWLPIEVLSPRVICDEVSFVHWQDGGHHHRAPVVTDPPDAGVFGAFIGIDGVFDSLVTEGFIDFHTEVSDETALYSETIQAMDGIEVSDPGPELGWEDFPAEPAAAPFYDEYAPLRELFESADAYAVTPEQLLAVAAIKGRNNIDAATRWLATCGVMAGSVPPCEPDADPFTGIRKRRKLTETQHLDQVKAWLMTSREKPRPPLPVSSVLGGVVEAILQMVPDGAEFDVTAAADGASVQLSPDVLTEFPTIAEALTTDDVYELQKEWGRLEPIYSRLMSLWESERDPHHGSWMFIRLMMSDGRLHIERAYDHWPAWFPDEPAGLVLNRERLINEFGSRTSQWRPPWFDGLLDGYALEDVAW